MTNWNAHVSPEPATHRFIPTGMGKITCAICQQPADAKFHHQGLRDTIGADVTTCPGCEDIWPIELTVRMFRFVNKRTGEQLVGRNVRVCQPCAEMPVDEWALLALRRDRGFMTEDRYLELVEALAQKALADPRPTAPQCEHYRCTREKGHPGPHRQLLAMETNRRP